MKKCFSPRSTRYALTAYLALLTLVLFAAAPSRAERLGNSVIPEHYDLTLSPDLKSATFIGIETIDVVIKAPTKSITLNSAEIAFQSVSITADGKQQTATVSIDKEKEQATFTVPDVLPAGKASLKIHYTGILNNELRGFYLSKTSRRNYAVTQFESTDARRAFPSFDEPAFKATFNVSLIVDSGDTAISNEPIQTDTPGPGQGKHKLVFATTPKMSTYLVAFLVGDFQCTTGEQDGVTIRSCATPEKVAFTPYSLEVAKFALHYYNNYFGIPYPLKKLDLIGIPDFEAGAMENFGAITFRESDFLVDPKTASLDAKETAAIDVAHEMAHQWFGDLVTMQWWDNVWLNEGFATWMENKAVAAMHPEWHLDQAVVAGLTSTLNLDSQPTTRAIRAKADTREEIEQMFDGISYGKASDVLLTVENYLGPETFRKGVHNYLSAHLYANATAEDFWNAETAASHKPVDKIMESLVAQPGAPILTFGEPHAGSVSVSQRRFYLSPSIEPDKAQKWTLPVCFKMGAGTQRCELLSPNDTSLKVPSAKPFFANAGGMGYYYTSYTPDEYAALVAQVETSLSPAERISLVGDEWAKLRADKASAGDYLNLVSAVKDDQNAAVVGSAFSGVSAIYSRVASTPRERDALAAWIRAAFEPVYAKLGPPSPDDSPNTRELRAQLFSALGDYGKDPAVLADAHHLAEQYIDDPTSVDATLGQTALYIAARNGDSTLFDKLQHVYETSTDPDLQDEALRLLAHFEDPALAQRALDYAVSGKVRNQDAAIQLAIALDADATRAMAWKFIQDHWDAVHSLLTPEMGSVLVDSTGAFCSSDARDDVKQFFSTHKVASADQAVKHSIERIDGCIELRTLQEPHLKSWLATQSGS